MYNLFQKTNDSKTPKTQKQKLGTFQKKQKVLILSGPTAAGKTDFSLSIAKKIGGEIISADSIQVYRGMDIGTAKVSLEERTEVRHHLIDECEISQPFNVVSFYNKAHQVIQDVLARDKVPIVVGGTGFYIHTLIYGPPCGPPSVSHIRNKIEEQMEKEGPEILYERLQILDPEYAATITERDRQKIIRGLEIIAISNKKVSSFQPHQTPSNYEFHCWFLYYEKEELHKRIEARCDLMIENGLIDEVKSLLSNGLLDNSTCANAIGYRQCIQFLQSSQSDKEKESFIQNFKQASRQYAKKQFTWFRKKEPLFRCLHLSDFPRERVEEIILQDFEQG